MGPKNNNQGKGKGKGKHSDSTALSFPSSSDISAPTVDASEASEPLSSAQPVIKFATSVHSGARDGSVVVHFCHPCSRANIRIPGRLIVFHPGLPKSRKIRIMAVYDGAERRKLLD